MAHVLLDRAKVVATSMSGTGDNYTLTNAPPTGFVDFTGVGDGNTTYYVAEDDTGLFEIGIGTFTLSTQVLARTDDNVILSSNAGNNNRVSWPSNSTPTVFISQPADKAVFLDNNDDVTITSTDDTDSANPSLILYRNSASPDDQDYMGQMLFKGRNWDGSATVHDVDYGKIMAKATDVTDGTEDGNLEFYVVQNGSPSTRLVLKGNGNTAFNNKDVILGANVDLLFDGATGGGSKTTLTATDPTSNRTITLPDAGGTVVVSASSPLSIDSAGNMSIGTVSIAADDITTGDAAVNIETTTGNITIDAQGNDTDIIFKGTDSDGVGDITMLTLDASEAGNATFSGNVTAFSDERLKSNIKTIDNALDKVINMRGVSFTKQNAKGIGVIAQEIEKVIPEVVHDGEYKSVAYGNIVGVLIEAIKEQQKQIAELTANLKELNNGL